MTAHKIRNFIDGQFVEPVSGKYLDNIEPATGKPYSQVADSDARDVNLAVAAAEKAFYDWSKQPAAERSRFLLRIADLIERDLEKFARAESIDTGKPITLARSLDIPRAVANFRFFATAILHTENEAHVTDGVAFNYTLRQPRGIAGLISPWNLPLYLLSWKIAPAIAVGNTSFANQGQICLCGSRVFVERSAYKDFIDRFIDKVSKLKIGDPLDEKTEQGAIVNKAQLDKVKFYVDLAQKEGGKIALGGSSPKSPNERTREGYFFSPTVIVDLPVACRTNREEIFGPVVTITPFDSEDEVIGYANDTDYGLASSVWTQNLNRAHRVAERISTGTVWVNCWLVRDLRVPFGGMKASGVGREGGEEALRFFTEPKNVCIAK